MKKRTYSTVIEIGDWYEFCPPKENCVMYGKVMEINYDTKSFDFECKNSKKYFNITDKYIRGIYRADEETWINNIL